MPPAEPTAVPPTAAPPTAPAAQPTARPAVEPATQPPARATVQVAARQPAPTAEPTSTLGWPFDPDEGPWTIVNGYRGDDDHGLRADGSRNYALFALDFALCRPDDVKAARGRCALTPVAEADDEEGTETSWDRRATRGADVLSPVDGRIAWVDDSTPSCLSFGLVIDGHPGYRLALFHVEDFPEPGTRVQQGEPLGTVAAKGCGPGDYVHMVLYELDPEDKADDPVGDRVGVPFAGDWAIAGCAYPDDRRTRNQYRGRLVPCPGEDDA